MLCPHKEVELKLAGTSADLRGIEQSSILAAGAVRPKRSLLTSVYFDTRDRKLHKGGITLRLRRDGASLLQTIKTRRRGQLFSRDEWENPIAPPGPDPKFAKATGLKQFRSQKLFKDLRPIFQTRVSRKTVEVSNPGRPAIVVALDKGTIAGGRRSADICEIELELKGPDADCDWLFSLARALGEIAPLWLEVRSKSDLGYALLAGGIAGVATPAEVDIPVDATSEDAFRLIATSCFVQIVANRQAVLAGSDAGIHQMRVGVRRLRAAFSIFKRMLAADPAGVRLSTELSWLANELGPARDLAVFGTKVIKPLAKLKSHRAALGALYHDVAARTVSAMERAAEAASSERLRVLFFDLAQWILVGNWSKASARSLSEIREMPAIEFATADLKRRHRKIRKVGARWMDLSPTDRHRLRIAAKKLRYGSEFFEGLFAEHAPRKQLQRFTRSLSDLQDALGELNDIQASRIFAESFPSAVHRLRPSRSRRIGYLAGLAQGRLEAGERDLLKSVDRAFARFAHASPPWGK